MSVIETLQERHITHGSFADNAFYSQDFKKTLHSSKGWWDLHPVQQEALDQIALKLSRILSTDGKHSDNWHDVAGYATLVEKWLKGEHL
jgi:hypothetical protein